MCGITGYYISQGQFKIENLKLMTNVLSHRGPDAHGCFADNHVGLGHRRLSILDPTPASDQPFFSADNRYGIIYNGEVYNFKELSNYLNTPLRTTGDTEVILELYIKYGPSFLNLLNGMFSLAIYDKEKNELFIARDRLGVKPLYYFYNGDLFLFASEIKAFKHIEDVSGLFEKDISVIPQFLKLGFVPEPNTGYKNIFKFPAGSYAILNRKKLTIEKYWSWQEKVQSEIITSETIAKEELKKILESSVKYRMISDVPFGTFLSGGIDSSLVTAIAQSVSDRKVKTFSIGFKESRMDESVFARQVADYLKTDHHEFVVTENDAKESLLAIMNNFDEPFSDSSALPTYMVSKLASKEVKMVLTGDGGDELFLGYGAYKWADRLSSLSVRMISPFLSLVLSKGNSRFKRIGKMFSGYERGRLKSHVFSQEQYFFTDSEIRSLVLYPFDFNLTENFSGINRMVSAGEYQALFDLNYYLKDDLLVKVDRASMFASIEAREPLLDYRLVEFSLNLSRDLKLHNGVNKYILRRVLYDYIPESFFNRPKKGFSIPLSDWLRKDLKFLIDDYLSDTKISLTGIFNKDEVNLIKKRFFKGDNFLFQRLWLMILIQRWMISSK